MEASSARAAKILNENGYQARAILGGLHAWQAAGYPLAGEHPGEDLKAA
jgi:rhodanese-related sulfurtransferase